MSTYWNLIHQVESYITTGEHPANIPPIRRKSGNESGQFPLTQTSLEALNHHINQCTKCAIAQPGKAIVGKGPISAKLLLLAPPVAGPDALGKAACHYVGQWIKAIGFDMQKDVYLTNTVKSICPNGVADSQVVQHCLPYLWHQITLIKPQGILVLGSVATEHFLDTPFAQARGVLHAHKTTPVVATYHPEEVLRDSSLKGAVWKDLQLLQKSIT